ncbi:MAG: hypothetical protein HDR24_00165 [Lachnospiraceae bacterium]|nr:hypothetical protein [Lachnospiraceae bacterium]
MRKYIKNHILEIVKSLFHANQLLKKLIVKNSIDEIGVLLQDMQAAAIEVGEAIEKNQGEGTEAVRLLEKLCELIWETSQAQMNEKSRLHKAIGKSLEIVQSQIQNIPERTEVVFLPYKACMWDSLESVWMAAEEDESCDAYVIPIPYCDKNPDGSFKEAHYEAEEYPDYVPITHFDDYNFEERYPDVIFIHNPYDEYNHMTSVHPFFYSKNLKQFTDKLVYIPYFILNEIDPDNKEVVGDIEHFCTMPAVLYADYVIVQSEAMRQIYINFAVNSWGKEDIPMSYWEKKILGLGSPKVDKVLTDEKEKVEMPKEWLEIVQKPDGTNKRIILYNTSVAALLNYEDRLLEKMKTVFRVFKEKQDEVALLWRPHPLMHAAIGSMRPQLREEYNRMEEQYKMEGWGIYDDTADMNRAIAVSDAYYGDMSSLVQLYQKTGKPIMIQNVECLAHTDIGQ